MSAITGWLTGILSIVVMGTVADLLLSENKTGKYVKSVFAAITVLVILLPIPSLIRNGINPDADFVIENAFILDENYLSYANRVKLSHLEKGVEEQLKADGITGASVRIEGTVTGAEINIQLVRVNLQNAVIDQNKQHINKYDMTSRLVGEYLNIEKRLVIVDGG